MSRPEPSGGGHRTGVRSPRSDSAELVLGIDLGGSKVVSALVDEQGGIVRSSGRELHTNEGPERVLRTLVASARRVLADAPSPPTSVGVAVAAQVDPRTGTVVHAPNLRWRDVPLERRVTEELGLPTRVLNDARAATWAEWRIGSGVGVSDFFCLILGTGVGGSAIIGGRLADGGTNALGEVGHLTIVSGGRRCHCPNFGCFEAYAGGWAIAERAREAIRQHPGEGRPMLERAGSLEAVTGQTVTSLYREGDPLARRLVAETERYIADGAVSVVNAFNPTRIALAGGILAGLPQLLATVESAVRARCQPPAAVAQVVRARFDEHAPMIGAALFAREDPPRP